MDSIVIRGAREHNLKNINVTLPRNNLIVISGVSGSGKSSLAFDTIYAEGQRRYVESLSAYARQFLGRMDKPEVDYIEGLSPAISIEQKTTSRNPRSTVGTITEIYDYLRLLFARIGVPYDPESGAKIEKQTVDEIIDSIMGMKMGSRIMILSPVVRGRKGEHQKMLHDAQLAGYTRVRIDSVIRSLDEKIKIDKRQAHTIEIVVDRIQLDKQQRSRVAESVEAALEMSQGLVVVATLERTKIVHERSYSLHYAYQNSELAFPELEPRLFSFNSPFGACPACLGIGSLLAFDPDLIIPDRSRSFNQGGILPYNPSSNWYKSIFLSLANALHFSLDTPLQELSAEVMEALLHGTRQAIAIHYVNKAETLQYSRNRPFPGILAELHRRYTETSSERIKQWLEGFMSEHRCETCHGQRLRPESLAVRIGECNIHEVSQMTIDRALTFFDLHNFSKNELKIATEVLKEISARLSFLQSVGLGYITLDRGAVTLSGGEAQRIRLATQIGSSLVGVLYILDEPTIGLHQRDNSRLLKTLIKLRDIGNTLIIVEHDEQMLRHADHILELGPGAGVHGGSVVAQGNVAEICAMQQSLTGQYLQGHLEVSFRHARRNGNGQNIQLYGASMHNLKQIDVSFPLGTLIVITGVSGSGKSTLLADIVHPLLECATLRKILPREGYRTIEGVEHIDKTILIDQAPIGRTPRSNPATYVGLFTYIRNLFSDTTLARARGYAPGRFSFNIPGGRCEKCHGAGTIKIEMHFLPDVYVQCDVCHGQRFNSETLEIRYKGKNIYEILSMTVENALDFFEAIPPIRRHLDTLNLVGLGYIELGQSALTFSGGEAQRIKLANELAKRDTGQTFYILDEPTTGLHIKDIIHLMEPLHKLVDRGNTVTVIEHNIDVILQADYIIDLGPEGGDGGGAIVAAGSPEEIMDCSQSHTGAFMKERLHSTR